MENENSEELNTAVGPGASPERAEEPKSVLEGISDYNFVEIQNPLTVRFVGQAALTTNINAPMPISANHENAPGLTKNESDIRQIYGFDLRAQAQQSGKTHIINRIPIESGQTIKLLGGEAKVILGQLTSIVMQREGKESLLANMHERRAVEERIVRRIGSLQEELGRAPLSVREQLQTTLNSLNEQPGTQIAQGDDGEQEFPDLAPVGAGTDTSQNSSGEAALGTPKKRGPGRRKT